MAADLDTLERRAVLEAFDRDIGREVHNLRPRPDILWQQLHNRLQWEAEPLTRILEPELRRRSTPGAAPWLRTKTPFRESEALIRILEGHTEWVWGCAVSPDGTWVVSASWDKTLRVWDATTGKLVVLPLLGSLGCVSVHPWQPLASCGDAGGALYVLDLVGLEYGPIIVTATKRGRGLAVRCPACQCEHPNSEGQLGAVLSCPTPGCGLSLRINPFVLNAPAGAADDWSTVKGADGGDTHRPGEPQPRTVGGVRAGALRAWLRVSSCGAPI